MNVEAGFVIFFLKNVYGRTARTKAGSHTLAARGEGERLPHCHVRDVEVVLADVGGRPLGHELLHAVPVVGHPARNAEVLVEPPGQREQQGSLA